MNKRQKAILIKIITVTVVTTIAVIAMLNVKDLINRSEAMRAMKHLGREVLEYKQAHGSLPSEFYVHSIERKLEGYARLGKLYYRALWLDFDSTPDEILAYSEKKYRSLFLDDGYVVLRFDGRVEWMGKQEFETLLSQQQTPMEIQMLRE